MKESHTSTSNSAQHRHRRAAPRTIRLRWWLRVHAVALLELLPRPARTRIVAADRAPVDRPCRIVARQRARLAGSHDDGIPPRFDRLRRWLFGRADVHGGIASLTGIRRDFLENSHRVVALGSLLWRRRWRRLRGIEAQLRLEECFRERAV